MKLNFTNKLIIVLLSISVIFIIYIESIEKNYTVIVETGKGIWKTALKCPDKADVTESDQTIDNKFVEANNIYSTAIIKSNNYVVYKFNLKTQFDNDPMTCNSKVAFDSIAKSSIFSNRVSSSPFFKSSFK